MTRTVIHIKEAVAMLKDREPHHLRVWKLATGDILNYKDAVYLGSNERGGTITVRLSRSGEKRTFRRVCLFEIDELNIYM